ncbi:MAG: hypothetical protein QOJ35_2689 [Solirubrobacteraceae bacterium]|nr:hypothetical protein [Solirubrobacteraceae bacterium]
MVVPKALRDALGIAGPTELDVTARDGLLELAVPHVAARVEDREGQPVIVTDVPMPPIVVDDVRTVIDGVRR